MHGQNNSAMRKTTAVSRAWRRTANWCANVRHQGKEADKEEARRKILEYRHPAPRNVLANEQQRHSFDLFRRWKAVITKSMLNKDVWVELLQKMAMENAEREERAAQHASIVKWESWIHEGPANGLRRQHRYSRTTNGWIPTLKATGVHEQVEQYDEIDQVEGFSAEQLNEIKFEHAHKGAPAYAQQQVDDQANRWHKEWGHGLKQEPIAWPSDLGEELQQLLVEQLLEAALTFPNETGLGWDRLHPKAIHRLSRLVLDLLVRVLVD